MHFLNARTRARQGFTLLELSIVLVVLGLLVGGVMEGQNLRRSSEIKSVITDYRRYVGAVQSFQSKYNAIPGDMSTATSFWGSLGGTGSDVTCQGLAATGLPTCNGDGDSSLLGVIAGTTYRTYEMYRFWQHLANAGLVEGQYTGTLGGAQAPGVNVPVSKISGAYFLPRNGYGYSTEGGSSVYAGNTTQFAGDMGRNIFAFTNASVYVNGFAVAGSFPLNATEAWNIDSKLDDGIPYSGGVWAGKGDGTNTNCTTFAGVAPPGDAGATYLVSNSSNDCILFFVNAF